MGIGNYKKNILVAAISLGNLAYGSFSGMDGKNSTLIRESGYGYARKAAYEPSRYFQDFEIHGESGDLTLGEKGEYKYNSRGVTGGTFGRIWREWILGLGYGYIESEGKNSEFGKKNLESLGGNFYLTRRSELWSFILSGGYTRGKNKMKKLENQYDYRDEIWSLGLELNTRYEHRKNYNIYPYLGFDYSWEKDKIPGGNRSENPWGKAGIIIEERHGQWLYSLDLAWNENFGEKDQTFGESGVGSFKYSIEKEIGSSMVWGIYYGGSFIEEDYFQRYGMSVKYNW